MQGQMQDRIETVRAGGDDHLVKPVAPGFYFLLLPQELSDPDF